MIGFLSASRLDAYRTRVDYFHRGLSEAGYSEGRNVIVEYRVAEDHNDRLPALAADLVERKVAVIATFSNFAAAQAAKGATGTIPIVFVMGANPLRSKIVTNLARPEGNMTGVTLLASELIPKNSSLLREVVPAATRIGFIVNYSNYTKDFVESVVIQVRALGVELLPVNISNQTEIDERFEGLIRQQAGAILVSPDAFLTAQRDRLVALAARYSIPALYFTRDFVEIGGLISYSSDFNVMFGHAGVYVGRILKGDKPADLPVLQPIKFALVINLKTAKALGLTIPPTLLARADEVIE
ncbi:MAG TPA: ABC transporter substrate-binding protein [Blastocatellia bacterium]|nr:ABC transporter substrate-binding protein [Blastocatellia bacterium]